MSGSLAADEYFPYVFFGPIQATKLDIESSSDIPATDRGVNFIDTFATKTGTATDVKEQLLGSYGTGGGGIIQRFTTSLMRMIAGADGNGGGDAYLEVESYQGGPSPGGYIGAKAVANGHEVLLVDSADQSGVLRWNSGLSQEKCQAGVVTVNCTVVGQQSAVINLNSAWPNLHWMANAWVANVNTSWPTIRGSVATNRSQILLVIDSPTIQTVTIGWMSFGH